MRISSKTNYALLTVMDLALHRDRGALRVAEVAKRQGIPSNFLSQILLRLKTAGIVRSRRGMSGGYELALDPRQISLSKVMVGIDGPVLAEPRADGTAAGSSGAEARALAELWDNIRKAVNKELEQTTISDMCGRVRAIERSHNADYSI